MERHAIPRQITTFEFKLIGFMTLKQFVYLALFIGVAILFFLLIRISFINIIVAGLIASFGAFFAFFKYNERSVDIWIKNIFIRLTSPSQYYFIKKNDAPYFIKNIYISSDPYITQTYIDAQKKLSNYNQKKGNIVETEKRKHAINSILEEESKISLSKTNAEKKNSFEFSSNNKNVNEESKVQKPYIYGIIKNSKNFGIPNIMIYVKNAEGTVVRILKTNSHGIFASFHPLANGTYTLEAKDLKAKFFFDTIKIQIKDGPSSPVTIFSKEML